MRTGCIARSGGSWRYRRRRGYSCVTTTRRPVATTTPGKRRCARSARTTSTSRGRRRRCLRRRAHGARRHAHRAAALVAVNPGQHPRRAFSAGGRQRRALSDDSGEVQESRSRALKAAVASTAPSDVPDDAIAAGFRGYRADNSPFQPAGSASELEEGLALTPKFDADGLVTAVATDVVSGDVLMVAHMNAKLWPKPSQAAKPGITAARAARYGRRAKSPATPSASSKCASTATRMRCGSK